MDSAIIKGIAKKENLLWAWEKTRQAYQVGDIWFDTLELANFEANLDLELNSIATSLNNGNYILRDLRPLPFPKGLGKDENNCDTKRVRQTFEIAVRDQVLWAAVVNVIGPDLDYQMPFWSFGNRLHHSIWYDESETNDQKKILKAGWYRNSSKNIYRSWKQSWPLFRHSIGLTIKKMSSREEYTDKEKEMEENNLKLPDSFCISYLKNTYWPKNATKELFWAGVDFEKFYPHIKIDLIRNNIIEYGKGIQEDKEFHDLLMRITTFKVVIDQSWRAEDIQAIGLTLNEKFIFEGLPTGLFVAGFLANVALMGVDNEISQKLCENNKIAHFRYVDDHVIIGYSAKDVVKWILEYETLLKNSQTGATFNRKKTEPKKFGEVLSNSKTSTNIKELEDTVNSECKIDPDFPSPLMTQTLAKVSNIADCDIDFLTENEERQIISDLEHLLITDFPDHELRSDTRISFAANMLSQVMTKKRINYSEVYSLRKEMFKLTKQIKNRCKEITNSDEYVNNLTTKYIFHNNDKSEVKLSTSIDQEKIDNIVENLKKLSSLTESKVYEIKRNIFNQKTHIFKLLLKAVKENHDKVKLWRRVVDYCYNTQISQGALEMVLDAIDQVHEKGKSHDLSNQFLYSLFVLVLSDRMMKALYVIGNIDNAAEKTKASDFVKACTDDNLINKILLKESLSNKYYYSRSFIYYRACLGSVIYATSLKEDTINKYKLLNWNGNSKQWLKNNDIEIGQYLFYLMYHLNSKKNSDSTILWQKFVQDHDDQKFSEPFQNKAPVAVSSIPNYINLYEWMDWCRTRGQVLENVFDTRLSELMSIKIVLGIIKQHLKFANTTDNFLNGNTHKQICITPANYFVPQEWVNPEYVLDNNELDNIENKVKFNKVIKAPDYRYTPYALLDSNSHDDRFYSIYGFSVLLTQLISHNYRFPWIWNIQNQNIIYSNYIFSAAKDITISSLTQSIIASCTLSRNRETFKLKKIYTRDPNLSDDSKNDPPLIVSLEDLIKYLEISAKELISYRIAVGHNQTRQLIPICLERITNRNNPFYD